MEAVPTDVGERGPVAGGWAPVTWRDGAISGHLWHDSAAHLSTGIRASASMLCQNLENK